MRKFLALLLAVMMLSVSFVSVFAETAEASKDEDGLARQMMKQPWDYEWDHENDITAEDDFGIEFDEAVKQDGAIGNILFKYPFDDDHPWGHVYDEIGMASYIMTSVYGTVAQGGKSANFLWFGYSESERERMAEDPAEGLSLFDGYFDIVASAGIGDFSGNVQEMSSCLFRGYPAKMIKYSVTLSDIIHYYALVGLSTDCGFLSVTMDYDPGCAEELDADLDALLSSVAVVPFEDIDFEAYNVLIK